MRRDLQRDIVRTILDLAEHDTTQLADATLTVPVDEYVSPQVLDAEQEHLFRTRPVVACLSGDLREAGDYVAADSGGVPYVVVRHADRSLRGFVNICRHRGSPLVPPGAGLGKASLALANRWITTRQFGLLLGFMGQRVLGQYDLALLSAEAEPGQLLFVEENVRHTARTLDVPLDPFRTWIALHETTHAFEFEAHPWLRPYLADRLERQLAGLSRSTSDLGRDASRVLGRALRGGDGHWLERLMSDEQRRLFRETQAVMSLLEGFSDHVMDEVGRDLVPGVATISARFHARRARRTPMERAILRITGLDLKMEQYARGERFVAAVERAAGPAGLRRLWEGPETLPRDDELERPERWVRRVVGTAAGPGPAGARA